ncbi:hypothetical protein BDV59DRAFT_206504 [Aspergillus ambiguus]|uniref:huntingtin-interacting protein K n=1 Tax=Aspergillus ambiguus TaxID=176160 RepID=UPI003CCD6B9D
MSDSIPSAAPDPDVVEQHLPANAEDRKAAAALSSLNTTEIAADTVAKPPSSTDQEALGKAMSRLEIAAGQGSSKKPAGEAQKKQAEVVKKAVKVSSEDVNLLVDQLDLNKIKATELLRLHEGDARKAIRAFITPSVGV